MTRTHKIVIERDTRGDYVATFPEWAGCRAQAGSLKTLMVRIQEAMARGPDLSGAHEGAAAAPAPVHAGAPGACEDL
jgi:hypothetical protein